MITKYELINKKDAENKVELEFDFPWDETSLSRVYDKLDAQCEHGCLLDVVSVTPISFDKERNNIRVKVVVDISDMLDEYPVEDLEE